MKTFFLHAFITTALLFTSCHNIIEEHQTNPDINHTKTDINIQNNENYYWYNGEKHYLDIIKNKCFVSSRNTSVLKNKVLNSAQTRNQSLKKFIINDIYTEKKRHYTTI